MKEDLTERIERAKELVQTVRHVPLATVNEDGSPHNTPVFAAFDDEVTMYWASSPQAQHSQNIAQTGQVFLVLFDSMEQGGGLFIQATARQLHDNELEPALKIFNSKRQALLRETVPREYFVDDAPQRLYRAEPIKLWVNLATSDEAGHIIEDTRHEIKLTDL